MVRRVLMLMLSVVVLGVVPATASASVGVQSYGNAGMYDNSTARARLLIDPTYPRNVVYLSVPTYLHLPSSTVSSMSTPTYDSGVFYQYAYNAGKGYLYALKAPNVSGAQFLARYPIWNLPAYQTATTTSAYPTLTFSATPYEVAGQDELSTEYGWQTIAVGQYLYSWKAGQWPTQADLSRLGVKVAGNLGNDAYQIDENPLIVPNVPVPALDWTTGTSTVLHLSVAVVGSWDGGLVAVPLGVPAGYVARQIRYTTSMDFPSDTTASLTSDPAYVGPCALGPACVVFGVNSWSHPRLVMLDLASGRHEMIGLNVVGAPVSDTVTVDSVGAQAGNPVIVAHDIFGTVYSFNLAGRLIALWKYGTSGTVEYAKDQSVVYDPEFSAQTSVMTVGNAATTLHQYPADPRFASVTMPGFAGLTSPTTLVGAGGISYLVYNYQGYRNLIRSFGPGIQILGGNAGSSFVNQGKLSNYQLISAPAQPYVGVVPDVSQGRFMVTYSNSTPIGPAIELLMPVQYAVRSTLSATTVPSAGAVTVFGRPIPSSVTNDAGQNPDRFGVVQGQGVESPMYAQLVPQAGSGLSTIIDRMVQEYPADPTQGHSWSAWYTQGLALPPNNTGKPIRWAVTVTARDKFADQAISSPMTLVEEPGASPPPSGGPGLTLNPDPAMWSQNVTATMMPSAPSLPAGDRLVSWSITSAVLKYPLKNPNWGTTLPYFPVPLAATATMTPNGHTASVKVQEGWWDGGCATPTGIDVCLVNQLLRNGAFGAGSLYPNDQTIPSLTSAVTATYSISGVESHTVTTWATKTDPKTGKVTKVKVVKTVQQPFSVGPQTASAQIVVSGDAKDVVGGG